MSESTRSLPTALANPLLGAKVDDLCRRCHVRRLDVFGSSLTTRFDPQTSDYDLLVSFDELAPSRYAEAYFELHEGLERLLGRPVDLVTAPALRNPFFRRRIEETKVVLYAA